MGRRDREHVFDEPLRQVKLNSKCDTCDTSWIPMPVGFQPRRELDGISKCWDVEDQRVLCFVVCSAPDVLKQRTQLRQKNIVEISDLRVLCFGSVFRFLVKSFTPSLIHTSSPHPKGTYCTPKMTSKQQTTGTHSELSLNLYASFTICQTKRPNFESKSQGSPIFGRFFGYHFFDGFFPSASGASRKRRSWNPWSPEAATSTGRPRTATSRRCGTSSVWLQSACHEKDPSSDGRWPQKNG